MAISLHDILAHLLGQNQTPDPSQSQGIPSILSGDQSMMAASPQAPAVQPTPGPIPPGIQSLPPPDSQAVPAQPPAAPATAVPTADDPPDIVATAPHTLPASKYKRGLLGGWFGVGHTGGNILGLLGDAFLAQAHDPAQYAPRLQQLRESEALQNYSSDPMQALQQYSQVNPQGALPAYNQLLDNNRQQALAANTIQTGNQQRQDLADKRGYALLGAATADNYPQVKAQYEKYYAGKGMEPPVDLPGTFDGAKLKALQMAGIPAPDQAKNAEATRYHDEIAATRAAQIAGLQGYRTDRLAQIDEAQTERGRHNHAIEDKPPTPSSVIGGILAKQAKGITLTPQEQAILIYNKPPKVGRPGGGQFKTVKNPDGSYSIQRN